MKYILCNADEGDPGAFMDRSVLEGDPHSLIEGMAVGAYAIGAHQGYVYVRAEYPLAVERLNHALDQAREYGLLGENILGSGFAFDLEIRMGSGAFVCGEETALMTSIEGNRGEPRPRPPFPAVKGLWDKPSLLNNVETFANIAPIILKGAEWYASTGTEKSKGTKVFALGGDVQHTGLVEVPIGMPLGELIYDIGGGIPDGKAFKAAQIGGPSGGCIPKQHLNVPIDYESLQELGAIMGSGGLIVMDEDTCMVDIARFFLDFVQDETCGKCPPCRVGTKRMLEILERICDGEGEEGDIERLVDLGETIRRRRSAASARRRPTPCSRTIRHFRDEYEEHIRDHYCGAGVCGAWSRRAARTPARPASTSRASYRSSARSATTRRCGCTASATRWPASAPASASTPARASAARQPGRRRWPSAHVKRFMVEQENEPSSCPRSGDNDENAKRKVAIVGRGPAGLSCAYFLARLGYKPVVFEAEQRAGGMLVQAIPAYRLPREELDREIGMIADMGVRFEYGKALGRDFTLKSLRDEGYEAVFVGVGAPQGMGIGVPGEDGPGVYDGLSFLKQYNLEGAAPMGKQVVVIGGGNAAIDAARTALRLGAESVKILYRRTRAQMPAWGEEIDDADLEGIEIMTLVAPQEILRDAAGDVTGVRCKEMALGDYDKSGRRRPVAGQNPDFVVEADTVIAAIGQSLDAAAVLDGTPVELNRWSYLAADPNTGQTSVDWVFAGGDAATGPSSVVEAIGAGERAAVGIDELLTGANHAFWRRDVEPPTFFDPDADPVFVERHAVEELAVAQRVTGFDEVELSWAAQTAIAEARRCLRCDYGKYHLASKES